MNIKTNDMQYWYSYRRKIEEPLQGMYKVKSKTYLRTEDDGGGDERKFKHIILE